MIPQRESNEKNLIFEDQSVTKSSFHHIIHRYFWSDRLALIGNRAKHDADYWNFELLMNESIQIRLPSTGPNFTWVQVFPLNDELGFIVEHAGGGHIQCFNLVKINWDQKEFQLIEKFERHLYETIKIFVDGMDSSKFILRRNHGNATFNYQICKFINGKIDFGEIHQSNNEFKHYSNNKLIEAKDSIIKIYNLTLKKEETFEIDESSLRGNAYLCMHSKCVNDVLYCRVYSIHKKCEGIVWADFVTKKWILFDFETRFYINCIEFFNGNLIVNTGNSNKAKVYAIPIKRPHHLRYSAWLIVVQVVKQMGEEDPYLAAKEFLPLNSDLRSPWFKDEEHNVEVKKNWLFQLIDKCKAS